MILQLIFIIKFSSILLKIRDFSRYYLINYKNIIFFKNKIIITKKNYYKLQLKI